MKLLYVFLFSLLLMVGARAETNYAVVNYTKIMQTSKAFTSFQQQVAKNKKELEERISKESSSLKKLEEEIASKRNEYSPVEFERKKKDFEGKVAAFRQKFQAKQSEFEKNSNDTVKAIEEASKKIIADISKEKNFEIVYQAGALAYYSSSKDISDEVLKRLNSYLPKVSLSKVSY